MVLRGRYNFISSKIYTCYKQNVFVKYYASRNKVQRSYFSIKVKVKVTKSLTLMSFERESLVEYACQI